MEGDARRSAGGGCCSGPKVGRQIGGRWVAQIAILLEASAHNARYAGRNIREIGSAIENSVENRTHARSLEGKLASGHLVHYPERENISAPVERLRANLLGRHMGDGPHDPPSTCERLLQRASLVILTGGGRSLRKTKV